MMNNSNLQPIFNLFQKCNSQSELEAIENHPINLDQFLSCVNFLSKTKKFNKNSCFQQSIVFYVQDSSTRILQFGVQQPIPSQIQIQTPFSSNDLIQNFFSQEKSRINQTVTDKQHNIRFTLKKEIDNGQTKTFPKKFKELISKIRFRSRFTFIFNKHLQIDLTQIQDDSAMGSGPTFSYEIEYEVTNWPPLNQTKTFNEQHIYENIIDIHQKLFNVIHNVQIYVSQSEKDQVLHDYNQIFSNNFKSNYLQFIGPKPISLEKENLIQFYNTPCILNNYTVTEKADGLRYSLFINSIGVVYLIDMQLTVKNTGISLPNQKNTIIDCELIQFPSPKKNIVAMFDILFHQNSLVANLPLLNDNSQSRLHLLDIVLSNLQNSNLKKSRYSIIRKNFQTFNQSNIGSVINRVYEKKYKYNIDGLIFTPSNFALGADIYDQNVPKLTGTWNYQFKWKKDQENTADFYVISSKSSNNQFPYQLQLFVKGKLHMFQGYSLYHQLQIKPFLIKNDYKIYPYDTIFYDQNINDCVWEFYFQDNQWFPLKKRQDKTDIFKSAQSTGKPDGVNDVAIVKQIQSTSKYSVDYLDFLKYNQRINPTNIINHLISDSQLYYQRKVERNKFKIVKMNNFHSIVKSQLYRSAFLSNNTYNNHIKRSIVELAVGKAGDLNKALYSGFKRILGFDIVSDNIQNLDDGAIYRSIVSNRKFLFSYLYLVADISQNLFLQKSYSTQESKQIFKQIISNQSVSNNPSVNHKFSNFIAKHVFGTVSCQFAIHYMFKDELSLDTFINNVDNFLVPGGTFIGTTLNKKFVVDLFTKESSDSVQRFKDDVLLWKIEALYSKFSSNNWTPINIFGNQLRVFIESINLPNIEYLVDFNVLQQKLSSKHILLTQVNRFNFFQQQYQKEYNDLSPYEKEYSDLNIFFIFQKSRPR